MESFLSDQRERRLLAERLIVGYNAGRSTTFYCTACTLLPTRVVGQAIGRIERQIATGKIDREDRKALAKHARLVIDGLARKLDIDLSLRRKKR